MDGPMPEKQRIGKSEVKSRKRSPFKIVAYAAGLIIIAASAFQVYYVLLGGNFHTALPNKVFRCGQLSGKDLEKVISEHNIRTVVNLRGCSPTLPWYQEETRATHNLNVAQEDICLSATRLPATHELRRLIEVLDRTEYPILLHCRHGSDRTGLASAVVLLMQPNVTFQEARSQLSVWFGHLVLGRLKYLDRFFDLYSEWLGQHGFSHSPDHFREWIAADNFPGEGCCWVESLHKPTVVACGESASFPVRIHNTGITPWRFCAGTNAGYHVGFIIFDDHDRPITFGRAGLFDKWIASGEAANVTVVLPPINAPGNYRVLVDIVDEQQGWFYQMGCEPWECEFVVVCSERMP
jgi:protein tyrosine phosphatase (PTP) superfamily phosphohydrolase (DUF442 family)